MPRRDAPFKASTFSTEAYAAGDRIDAFRAFQGPVYDVSIPETSARNFRHINHFWRIEEDIFMELESGEFTHYRGPQSDEAVESRIHVCLVERGNGLVAIDDQAAPLRPGQVIIYHMLNSRYFHNQDKRSGLAFNFPGGLIGYDPKRHPSVMFFQPGQPQAEALKLQLRTIHKLLAARDGETAAFLIGGLREVVRQTLCGDPLDPCQSNFRALRFRSMLNHIDANLLFSDLTPDYLCKKFGISRAALYRLFDPLGGISTYVTHRRLDRAFRLLNEPSHIAPIGTIARWLHFHDASHFSNSFKRRFGAKPRDVRRASQAQTGTTDLACAIATLPKSEITLSEAFF